MKNLIIICLCLMAIRVYAQYPYPDPDDVKYIKDKALAVQLLEEETEVEAALNTVLKEIFDAEWELGVVEYFSPKEFESAKRKSTEQYFFLDQEDRLSDRIRFDFSYIDGSLKNLIMGASEAADALEKEALQNYSCGELSLDYADFTLSVFDGKKERVLTHVTFMNDMVLKHDYLFLSQQLQHLLKSALSGVMRANYLNHERNIDVLTNSTFLLPMEYFESTVSLVDKTLETDYEVLEFVDYQSKILNKALGVYFKVVFSYQHNKYMWLMVDARDGQILSVNECGVYKFSGTFTPPQLIKPRTLKLAFDMEFQLLNDYYNK
ncbi:MAG: hypothetical protein JXQ90_17795 [Cyclobacteriaceae bacterium]